MTKLIPLAVLALLSACDKPAPVPTKPTESGYIAKVRALTPGQREVMLYGAIQKGGGQACQGIDKVEPMPPTKNDQPVWRVTCTEGSQWSVVLADDGTALVTGARTSTR